MSEFCHEFTVESEQIDENNHMNNVVYLQWMQEISKMHSESVYSETKFNIAEILWVVRSHNIRYILPAKLGDIVELCTHISESKGVRAWREYAFILKSGGRLIAEARTEWVCIDPVTLKPKRVPKALVEAFAK